jgi:hypothetical protein
MRPGRKWLAAGSTISQMAAPVSRDATMCWPQSASSQKTHPENIGTFDFRS